MNKGNKIKVVIATLMVAMAFGAVVPTISADSENVTTTWIVPGDTTISVSYPSGEGKIEFDATDAGQNFTDLGATSMNPTTAALKVTNQGNQDLNIDMSWSSNWPTGVRFVNISVNDDTNGTSFSFGAGNATVDQTVATISDGGNEEFWFWTTGNDVAQTDGVDRDLIVTSSAA
jgi:hypothetical protein